VSSRGYGGRGVRVIWDLTPPEMRSVLGRYGAGQGELATDREWCLRYMRSAMLACPDLVGAGAGKSDAVSRALERFADRLAVCAARAEGRAAASGHGAATVTGIYEAGDGEMEANARRQPVTGPGADEPR
jgi:hypothetical protein